MAAVLMLPFTALHAEERYVAASALNVRLCPATSCPVTNKIYRGDRVDVYELKDGWARISKFYDAAVERLEFPSLTGDRVARWVSMEYLSKSKPSERRKAELDPSLMDPRIKYAPDVGDYGLTLREVTAIRKYALKLLDAGVCSAIVNSDKSVNKAGLYYVQCEGESQSRYFRLSDVE